MEKGDSMELAVNEEGRLMLPEEMKAVLRGEACMNFRVYLSEQAAGLSPLIVPDVRVREAAGGVSDRAHR